MDNQDDNKASGGLANISKNLLEGKIGPTEQVKKLTDASGQDGKNSVIVQPGNLENVQSQSLVETTREGASEELAQIKAFNQEMERQRKLQERRDKARRFLIFLILAIFGLIVVGVLVWMLVNTFIAARQSVAPGASVAPEEQAQYDTIDGYQCKTSNCYKVTELPDERILIRDDNFYLYDTNQKQVALTTIENQEYHDIKPFKWGDKIYLELDPESDKAGIYSVTDNAQVISFKYDTFYTDISSNVYKEMTWVEGQYIVAQLSGSYRLVRVYDGQEIIRGSQHVFIHDNFCISFEQGGERRIYTKDGEKFKVVELGAYIFIHNDTIVYVPAKGRSFELYDATGTKLRKGGDYDTLRKIKSDALLGTLQQNSEYYQVFTLD